MKIVVNNKTIFAGILSEATNEFRQLLITNAGSEGWINFNKLIREEYGTNIFFLE